MILKRKKKWSKKKFWARGLEVELLEVIGFMFYRFPLMDLISPKEVKWNWVNSIDLVETTHSVKTQPITCVPPAAMISLLTS